MKISALIITFGRPALLDSCLKSLLLNSVPPGEILVGINGDDPSSEEELGKFAADPRLRVVSLPALSRGEARNRLLAAASGEIAVFLDDDVVVPDSYFRELGELAEAHPDCVVFGGGQTEGRDRTFFERISYKTLGSFWGSGIYRKRFVPLEGPCQGVPGDFILCNMAVRTEFLRKHGIKFPGRISSAEENWLLSRIELAGGKMLLSGLLNVFHRHRRDPVSYARQIFSFGRGRGQLFAATGDFLSFSAVPPLFALLSAGFLFWKPAAAAGLFSAYLIASFLFALGTKGSPAEKGCVFLLFPVTHAAYAAGVAAGFAEELVSGRTRGSL